MKRFLMLVTVFVMLVSMIAPAAAQDEPPEDCDIAAAVAEADALLEQAGQAAELEEQLALFGEVQALLHEARYMCARAATVPPALVRESTRTAPIPLGQSGIYEHKGRLWVISYEWLKDEGHTIIEIGFSCEASPDTTCSPSSISMSLIGASGKIYDYDRDHDQDFSPRPRFKDLPEMYGGEPMIVSGYVSIPVSSDEESLVLSMVYRNLFFALE